MEPSSPSKEARQQTTSTVRPRLGPVGALSRFVSCGLLSLTVGIAWRVGFAPHQMGIGSALGGLIVLLSGFIVGGLLWYARDARLRAKGPELLPGDERVFSTVVFVLVPLAVLALVVLLWVAALLMPK